MSLIPNRRLGAIPASHPKGLPELRSFRALMAPKPLPTLLRTGIDPRPEMLGNDTIGDCTSVGVANAMNAFAALNKFHIRVSTGNAIKFYSQSTGYVDGDPSTDKGGDPTQVLTSAATLGYPSDYYRYYPSFGVADRDDRNALANVMTYMGTVYGAFALASADADAYQNGLVWDTTTPGDHTLWSWGGHLALPWSYTGLGDTDIVEILTWGGKVKATWRWVHARLYAAYGLSFHQLFPASNQDHLEETWAELNQKTQTFLQSV